MGFALKIKNVNFENVALDRVTYIDTIPCEGITLNTDSITVATCEAAVQLLATLTPADTTDQVVWTTSNENVATVSSGLVTVHGIGTATITATCGTQSATATVTQTSIKPYGVYTNNGYGLEKRTVTGTNGILKSFADTGTSSIGRVYNSSDDTLHIQNTSVIECIPVPYGASKVKFTTTDGQQHKISYLYRVNTASPVEYNGSNYPEYIDSTTFVKSDVGADVSYGQAIVLRPTSDQLTYVGDVYFD